MKKKFFFPRGRSFLKEEKKNTPKTSFKKKVFLSSSIFFPGRKRKNFFPEMIFTYGITIILFLISFSYVPFSPRERNTSLKPVETRSVDVEVQGGVEDSDLLSCQGCYEMGKRIDSPSFCSCASSCREVFVCGKERRLFVEEERVKMLYYGDDTTEKESPFFCSCSDLFFPDRSCSSLAEERMEKGGKVVTSYQISSEEGIRTFVFKEGDWREGGKDGVPFLFFFPRRGGCPPPSSPSFPSPPSPPFSGCDPYRGRDCSNVCKQASFLFGCNSSTPPLSSCSVEEKQVSSFTKVEVACSFSPGCSSSSPTFPSDLTLERVTRTVFPWECEQI